MKMQYLLLRRKPYKSTSTSVEYGTMKTQLSPLSGISPGSRLYQVRREDGVLFLIPEKVWHKNGWDKKFQKDVSIYE